MHLPDAAKFQGAVCADPEHWPLVDAAFTQPGRFVGEMRERLCNHCPVSTQCLEAAMTRPEWGVWGGTSPHVRTRHGAPSHTMFRAENIHAWTMENLCVRAGRQTNKDGGPIHGLEVIGAAKGVRIDKVLLDNFRGYGLRTDSQAAGFPGGWEVTRLNITRCAAGGWRSDNTGGAPFAFGDSVIATSEVGGCNGDGWYWAGAAAVDFTSLRSTWNLGNGFVVQGPSSNVDFGSCQTDRSSKNGWLINCPEYVGEAPAPHVAVLTNCHASRDGRNDDLNRAGYAGFRIVGESAAKPCMPVSLNGVQTHVAGGDGAGGLLSPDYGVLVENGSKVLLNGSILCATVAPVQGSVIAGVNAYYKINPVTRAVTPV